MIQPRSDCSVSHNVYSDKYITAHYIQCFVPEHEALIDKLCGAAAILLLIAALPLAMVAG
jgi:phosphate starvation-inducible membrane PsiE